MQETNQKQTPNQPAPDLAPPPEQPPAPVTITTPGPGGTTQTLTVPRTSAEVRDLRVQRDELSEQLATVVARRRALSEEIRVAPDGASRTGLEERLRVLDQRILAFENDISGISRQLAAAPAELIAEIESEAPPSSGGDFEEGFMAGGFTLLGVIVVLTVVRRFIRKRRGVTTTASVPANFAAESAQRLERLEHGVEAIAIEVERVSEGQRFVTRLLSEQAPVLASNRIPQPAVEAKSAER
jgi:hypothetical protein